MPKRVGVENLERINKTSSTSLSIFFVFLQKRLQNYGATPDFGLDVKEDLKQVSLSLLDWSWRFAYPTTRIMDLDF
jgi:hypothetical protein